MGRLLPGTGVLRTAVSPASLNTKRCAATQAGRFPTMEPLKVGDWSQTQKVFDASEVSQFASLSEDTNPLHLDAAFAEKTRFKGKIVHGMLSASLFSGILGSQIPGAIYVSQTLSFKAPIYVGERITAKVSVTTIHPSKPLVTFSTQCLNADGGLCVDGEAVVYIPHQYKKPESRISNQS